MCSPLHGPLCLAAVLPLAACAPPPAAAPSASPASPASAAVATDEWRCGGDLVPPTGWQQDTAFVDSTTGNARDRAATEAAAKLGKRLCTEAGGTGCDFLTARIKPWKTGTNGKDVCAMAVIKAEELTEWRNLAATVATLDDRLAAAAGELLHGVAAGGRVAIDQVVDMGVPGGARADWLRARMDRLLAKQATVVDVPKRWAGDGVPAGVDVVVRANLVSRMEMGVATVESTWSARFRDGHHVASAPVTFPEQAGPRPPTEAQPTLPSSAGLSVRLDSDHGGSLCAGERTQIWLRSDAAAFVRVFDLYGAGEALVTYPTDDMPNAHVEAGQSIPLGGRLGFEATPAPGSESERFLVIAASTERELGRFSGAKGECRVPSDLAHQLSAGQGVPPGVKVATTGYRIITGPSCPAATGPREGAADAIASIPLCKL
jgi:hypothetical protein